MPYLVKCEINGIQDFIFNIPAKRAARALKARSFLIESLCYLVEHELLQAFPRCEPIFCGGGNVYLLIQDEAYDKDRFAQLTQAIAQCLLPWHLTCSFCAFEHAAGIRYATLLQSTNQELQRNKLQPGHLLPQLFAARPDANKTSPEASRSHIFTELTRQYTQFNQFSIAAAAPINSLQITGTTIQLLGSKLVLEKAATDRLIPLPVWDAPLLQQYEKLFATYEAEGFFTTDNPRPKKGDIVSFQWLGIFAQQRTGTARLGVLKLDVDNLGKIFQLMPDKPEAIKLSQALSHFFAAELMALLRQPFATYRRSLANGEEIMLEKQEKHNGKDIKIKYYACEEAAADIFIHNIYTVFAGGDDCFFIGAWDAVTAFALTLQQAFHQFQEKLRKELTMIQAPITLSASLSLLDENYPVVQMAQLAEAALYDAKYEFTQQKNIHGHTVKNRIAFMGHIFSWDEMQELVKVKNTFREMVIKYDENKAFLQRIIQSFDTVDNSYWQKCSPAKPFDPALLWRFYFSLRDVSQKAYFVHHYYDTFFNPQDGYYQQYLLGRFEPGKQLSQTLPVAARWVELLCRN